MKRLFLIVLICLTAGLFAAATQEEKFEPGTWDRMVHMAGGRGGVWESLVYGPMREKYNIDFSFVDLDESTGQSITMPALVAANAWPDIYVGFIGRMGAFMTEDTALPLVIDESVWDTAILDTMRRNGKLLGLPHSLPVQGIAINTDILDRANFPVPDDDWTIYDFLDMCEAVKQLDDYAGDNNGVGVWPTFLYAKNMSADYFYVGYFASFGAELFKDNDYTRSAVNDTEGGVNTMRFLKEIVDRGYTPKDSAQRPDVDMIVNFREGNVAATGFRPNWVPGQVENAVKNGKLEEPFNYVVLPFPVAPGVSSPPPMPGIGTGAFAHITDNPEKAAILTEIIERMMSSQENYFWDEDPNDASNRIIRVDSAGNKVIKPTGDIQTRLGLKMEILDEQTGKIIDIARTVGFMDPGYAYEWYIETRGALPTVLRKLYNGDITPVEAALEYESEVNRILKEYSE